MSNLNYPYPFPSQYRPGFGVHTPSTMSSQRFCLRWNNHQSNLLSVFDQLLHDESFVDVTIAVEGQLLRAHKMVLSACSPYFQALFVNHPDKHPIVILKDVPYNDMRSLLDFMYRGEVSVDQDRLTAFLRTAESLRIKGLTEVNEEKCDNIASSLIQQQHNQMNNPLPQLQRLQQPKRFSNTFNMLGNALLQPKRKRGRPRKLSGSSNGIDDYERSDSLVQGSPEMLEVKMGMDNFTGNNSDTSSGKPDRLDQDCDDINIKSEPTAGTSKESTFNNNLAEHNEHDFVSSEDQYYQENNQNQTNLPASVIVEVTSSSKLHDSVFISTETTTCMLEDSFYDSSDEPIYETDATGVHFLTDNDNGLTITTEGENYEKKKSDLLEYLTRSDGSVVCKLCGEVLASRTHWYRHKYKFHVSCLLNPAPLLKCTYCNVFFKSRKGYTGHISARHSENSEKREEVNIKEESETIELVRLSKKEMKPEDVDEQRVKEEKLVADIIDRVRKECEAQGSTVSRKGYNRRSTVMMNSCGN